MQIVIPLIIGLILGLLGGGGTILAVPALTYLFSFSAKQSIAISLFVVGVSSLISAIYHIYKKNVSMLCTLVFGLVGMLGSYISAKTIAPKVSEANQIVLFALVMFIFSFFMIKDFKPSLNVSKLSIINKCTFVAFAGFIVGILTGLIGVGGGFLIVPSLMFLLGLDIKKAVGSSFLVIALQSFTALIPYFQTVSVPINFLYKFTGFVVLGSFIGVSLSSKIDSTNLKKIFGFLLIVLSGFMLIDKIL